MRKAVETYFNLAVSKNTCLLPIPTADSASSTTIALMRSL